MTIAEAEPTGASPDDLPRGPGADAARGRARRAEAPVEPACPSCGAALAEGQDWCLECGTAVSADAPPPDSQRGRRDGGSPCC